MTLMLKNAKENGLTAWVRAKMALRAGDVNAAAAWYAKAAASFPPNETWGFQSYSDDIVGEEFVTPVCRIHAEQAILRAQPRRLSAGNAADVSGERKLLAGCRAHCRTSAHGQ
ncbi:hypothetical protein LNP74_05800 [Klebsiella pneumoniae subsp. pneumoniae]|nr:hypothetical protein [Klebsiella pneumoniae subsp. pneumoniae]